MYFMRWPFRFKVTFFISLKKYNTQRTIYQLYFVFDCTWRLILCHSNFKGKNKELTSWSRRRITPHGDWVARKLFRIIMSIRRVRAVNSVPCAIYSCFQLGKFCSEFIFIDVVNLTYRLWTMKLNLHFI